MGETGLRPGSPSVSLKRKGRCFTSPFFFLSINISPVKPKYRFAYHAFFCSSLALVLLTTYYCSVEGMHLWTPAARMDRTHVTVEKGHRLSDIMDRIDTGNAKRHGWELKVYSRVTGIDRAVKTGGYDLGPRWSPAQILEQVSLGPNAPNKVTVPPGLTLRQAARRFEEAGWVRNATAFLKAASGPLALEICGKQTMEGLLDPETYFFDVPEPPEAVIKTLHQHWKASIETLAGTSELSAHLRNGLTLYDTIILASLVEKEAASSIEMATVASVFHNRLRKNWPMGSAATLRYALHDWTRGENELPTKLKSPFNTNRRPGLPPHPICLPGKDAIMAALYPPDTPFLFFVADGEGGTHFTKTHKEHIRAAKDYRKKMRAKRN